MRKNRPVAGLLNGRGGDKAHVTEIQEVTGVPSLLTCFWLLLLLSPNFDMNMTQ